MKKSKLNIFLFASSIFFIPSLNLSNPTTSIIAPHISYPSLAYLSSYKEPRPTLSGKVSFQTLSASQLAEFLSQKINISPIPSNNTLEELFSIYASKYAVSAGTLRSIAFCESRFDPNAVNGMYGGMYQYSTSTWVSTRNSMGENNDPTLRFNAQESIKTTAFKIAAGGISAWPNCH